VLRELVTKPFQAAVALVELPLTARRSLDEVNRLMEVSRQQLETMQRQTDTALDQAERMNDLLAKVVKLAEPLERAQRGGEYVVGGLKQMIFGEESGGQPEVEDTESAKQGLEDVSGEGRTIRVIPNQPRPEGDEPKR
jgi:hypothetical protein